MCMEAKFCFQEVKSGTSHNFFDILYILGSVPCILIRQIKQQLIL